MRTEDWIKQNAASLAGKRVAISGSTGGIGRVLCEHLASLGVKQLILLDRDGQRMLRHRFALLQKYPHLHVGEIHMDLSDMESVRYAAKCLEKQPIDVLICNAGAYAVPRYITSSGLDNVFQINFAAPYYLMRRLTPHLAQRGGRVVLVGSVAHRYSLTDPDDVDFRTREKASLVYGNAKRYLMIAAPEAAAKAGLPLAMTHPGITVTGITAHYPKWIYALIKYPMKVIFMHPRRACLSILRGVYMDTQPGEWIGPRRFDVWGLPKKSRYDTYNAKEKARVCAEAERIYDKLVREETE